MSDPEVVVAEDDGMELEDLEATEAAADQDDPSGLEDIEPTIGMVCTTT